MSDQPRREAARPHARWWEPRRELSLLPRSIVELLADRVLDAELAALLWLLIEARLPLVVTGPFGAGRTTLLTALLDFLPADARAIPLAGAEEEFEWLPEAPELGWRRERPAGADVSSGARTTSGRRHTIASSTVLLVAELGDGPPHGTWGPRARIAIRALSVGYGMAATMTCDGLEEVLARLRAAPISADDDELSRLGIVLVMKSVEIEAADGAPAEPHEPPRRVVAAHYVRPVVRDAHGHVQRMPPAILAAHEPRADRLEHFAWGIVGELAGRTGRRPIDFEREQARRASYLAGLVAAGITDTDAVRTAIAGYRGAEGDRPA